jgi:hypothetical protein
MCDKCVELERKIEHYERIRLSIADQVTVERIKTGEKAHGREILNSGGIATGSILAFITAPPRYPPVTENSVTLPPELEAIAL